MVKPVTLLLRLLSCLGKAETGVGPRKHAVEFSRTQGKARILVVGFWRRNGQRTWTEGGTGDVYETGDVKMTFLLLSEFVIWGGGAT